VIASYRSPHPLLAPIDPAAGLSPDGAFLFAGALGLGPSSPAGVQAAYQLSSSQAMVDLQSVNVLSTIAYSLSPTQPWSPNASELLAGTAVYACDACGSLRELQAAAASRIAWSVPLSSASDHAPSSDPYQ
jgi:hypothetical protein